MRSLADDIADNASRLILNTNELAVSVVHHPPAGQSVSVAAIVQLDQPVTQDTDAGERQVFTGHLMVSADVGATVTAGRETDVSKFEVYGHKWRAVSILTGGGTSMIGIERNVTGTIKKGFRQGVP